MSLQNSSSFTRQSWWGSNSWNEWIATLPNITVQKSNGSYEAFDVFKIINCVERACEGIKEEIQLDIVVKEVVKNLFDRISTSSISDLLVLAASSFIEKDPAYDKVASKLLLQQLYREVYGISLKGESLKDEYKRSFINGITAGIDAGILDHRLASFDLQKLAKALLIERDTQFTYIGLQTLMPRYLLKVNERRIELPQSFWMRIAMGLALTEDNASERAIEFYELLSSMRFVSSTPTLLHSGLTRAQLSSCYLTTINDDLGHIFKSLGDIAFLSKWSGGVASDWTNLRATGAPIKTINVESQGVIPFLKIANDVTAAINRSGKRRSATVAYLESWHYDFEDFLDLRRNTGDERRRAHDMNFASWIPDLFIKRILEDKEWTLFSPDDVRDLHDLYGAAFDVKYAWYEEQADKGNIVRFKKVSAAGLWRKMITRLFETGYPWMTFKDPSNVRSPQDHVGVVHSSNLCTEITLNTSADETAVCNLGSVNLAKHIINGKLDEELFAHTITTAMRMLDNVIDINFYPTAEAKNSNLKHRPVGLGMMAFQDALYKLDITYDSQDALQWADEITEKFSYYAIWASSVLSKERGAYQTYKGSKWDRSIFPLDTLDVLEQERKMPIEVNRNTTMNWAWLKEHVRAWGMRNSNTMAIAPTATISNIAGCYPCIEPIYSNLYVKANMAGEFTVVNSFLVEDLKKVNLWSDDMLEKIKYFDGSVQQIEEIPLHIRRKYKGAFELDAEWMVKISAVRSKWIDQSLSHNVFVKGVSGQKLSDVYLTAWKMGMKTTYYLRSLGASQIEKSTLDAKKFGYTQKRDFSAASIAVDTVQDQVDEKKECSISSDPECDVCQ